jgi:hypothetical protein
VKRESILFFDYASQHRPIVGAALVAVGDEWNAASVTLSWDNAFDPDFQPGTERAPVALARAVRKGAGAANFNAPGVKQWIREFGAASNSLDLLGLEGKRRGIGIADATSLVIEGTPEDLGKLLSLPEVANLARVVQPGRRD